ncbi:MAG TPA: hypothetical protein VGG28_26095, partial [Kofleriaceae bacterium]
TNFTCDNYDVEIIDSTGTDCFISDYGLCGDNDEWLLTDSFFDGCASTEPDVAKVSAQAQGLPVTKSATAVSFRK